MSEPIYGVVPNFSEGRRVDVMDAICDALQVPDAHLVYRQADADHHRLDTTVLGSRAAVGRAAVAAARVAVALIDMEHHRGGHPRMGATDVIPFMPVRDVAMDDCVELAREVGAELADLLDLPGLPLRPSGPAARAPVARRGARRASTRVCARPSRAGSGCPTSART